MTDKEFCIEFAKRIKEPAKTNSNWHIIEIVRYKRTINISHMFSDIQIERLFSGDNVYQDVYKYVRDHQEEFCQSL